MDPPAIGQQRLAEAPADIAATGDHHCLRHEAVSFLQQGGQCRRRIVCNARPIMPRRLVRGGAAAMLADLNG